MNSEISKNLRRGSEIKVFKKPEREIGTGGSPAEIRRLKKHEYERIDESVENWKKWEDETVSAIQSQIDALDELRNAHDEENQREEYETKRQALELQARYEKDDYNRKQIKKEIARLDKEENERLYLLQIEEQKKALQEQQEAVKKLSSAQQETLTAQKETISNRYEALMSDLALQGEAKNIILNQSQDEIVRLINTYARDYEMLGTTLGESLYSGISKKVDDINAYVDNIANRTDTQNERFIKSVLLNSYVNNSDKRQAEINKNSVERVSEVGQIQSALNNFAKTIDQISAAAAAYKNQMAVVASSAANQYYSTQQKYYSTNNQSTVNKPTTNVYMTVNFNDKVDSPIQVKRQMESVAKDIAKQIS